jgi:hypothetical protein
MAPHATRRTGTGRTTGPKIPPSRGPFASQIALRAAEGETSQYLGINGARCLGL